MADANNHLLPAPTYESWRMWLMTGIRRGPVDRRRLRGAHRGLKKMLLEGAGDPTRTHRWKEFSDAMVRHAVDEAMRSLPTEETAVVKLAFFGGYTNREIASQTGMAEGTVQRRLREGLDKISEYVQRGRALGRRAFYALLIWWSGHSVRDVLHQTVQTAAVAAAATIVVASPASNPSPTLPIHELTAQPTASAPQAVPLPATTAAPTPAPTPAPTLTAPVPVQPPSGQVVTVPSVPPLPVQLPPLPTPPPIKLP